MATIPKKSKKIAAKTSPPSAKNELRKLQKPTYRSFRLQKRITADRLPSAITLFRNALRLLGKHWRLFLGIACIYGVLIAVLVQGFSTGGSLNGVKDSLDQLFTGNWGKLASSLTLFVYLLGSSGNTASPTAGAYQFILTVVVSLALIWTLRQLHAGHLVKVRDGFYNGMNPLIQFVLVLLVIGLQLAPMAIGLGLYTIVVSGGIATSGLEQTLWALLAFCLSVLSLYMVTSSLFALYIVALPNMTPLQALRSARQLVLYRRWSVMRKLLFLPVVLVVSAGLIMIPLIMFAASVAPWAFFALSMLLVPVVHSYMYGLYRSLL